MIDMRHNKKGYAVLAMTLVILLAVGLLAIFITKMLVNEHRSLQNKYAEQQALHAAKAGLEYGLKYAEANRATITNGQVLTGTLGNNTAYSVQINFLSGDNNLLEIVSTGTSPDSVATRVVAEKLKWQENASGAAIDVPLIVKGTSTLDGNTEIINIENNNTINTAAGTVNFAGSAQTTISSGVGSDTSGLNADVSLNDADLASQTSDEFETAIFGDTIASMVSAAASNPNTTYTNTGATNYNNDLHNTTGEKIYINQNGGAAILNSNTDVGTAVSPVTLVVHGSLEINGNVNFYGDIYVDGDVTLAGNAEVFGNVIFTGTGNLSGNTDIDGDVAAEGDLTTAGNLVVDGLVLSSGNVTTTGNTAIVGGLAVGGTYNASGNTEINYDSTNAAVTTATSAVYGVVPGSWKDY